MSDLRLPDEQAPGSGMDGRGRGDEPLEPFAPRPRSTGPGGCSRPMLIGCGVLIVLLGLGAVVFVLKARDLFGWAMMQFEREVVAALPDDITYEERERLSRAFAAATEAVKSGEADPMALQRLQARLAQTLKRVEKLSREDVLRLTLALEEVAGLEETPDAIPEPSSRRVALRSRGGQGETLAWGDGYI